MEFTLTEIGVVESPLKDLDQCPHQGREGAPEAWIVIHPAYSEALKGLKAGDEIVILTWMHLADRTTMEVHPRRDRSKPLTGVFATRSPHRPNPIGLHRATIAQIVPPGRILVKPLEALNGTPVIDIKISLPDDFGDR